MKVITIVFLMVISLSAFGVSTKLCKVRGATTCGKLGGEVNGGEIIGGDLYHHCYVPCAGSACYSSSTCRLGGVAGPIGSGRFGAATKSKLKIKSGVRKINQKNIGIKFRANTN